jgi:tRNA uridine 5-carbamoylmethylation protein Kti12
MKIVRYPYQANIVPQPALNDTLWHCVIRRDGSQEIIVRRDAISKEDAWATALLEITRLERTESPNPRLSKVG